MVVLGLSKYTFLGCTQTWLRVSGRGLGVDMLASSSHGAEVWGTQLNMLHHPQYGTPLREATQTRDVCALESAAWV